MEAALNAGQTLFICFLLGIGAMTFSNDANVLVLRPIERMIAKLEKIRTNPLEAVRLRDEETHREQMALLRRRRIAQPVSHSPSVVSKDTAGTGNTAATLPVKQSRLGKVMAKFQRREGSGSTPEPMETVVLEKTIIKIGSLLALGFGEAGAEIIGQNMKGSDNAALNAMIPGRKVEAIFGFADIRDFMVVTEALHDQVMIFVNRIACVVHACTHDYYGSPNKNLCDSFLLVWRLSGQPPEKQQRLADMSLVALIKIVSQVGKSPNLAEYKQHARLLKRMPGYRVRVGFGLHFGWAIEGAIGSEFKIDASYLGQDVNMATRLERISEEYNVQILVHSSVVDLMSSAVRKECRNIDRIVLAGSPEPFRLYTIDLDDHSLEVDKQAAGPRQGTHKLTRQRFEKQKHRLERWMDEYVMHTVFKHDAEILTMRYKYTEEFFCRFTMGFLNYEAGEWDLAQEMLAKVRNLLAHEDGPSARLLDFMASHEGGRAPAGWRGYRHVHER